MRSPEILRSLGHGERLPQASVLPVTAHFAVNGHHLSFHMKWCLPECFVLPAKNRGSAKDPLFLLKEVVAFKIMIVLVVILAHNSQKICNGGPTSEGTFYIFAAGLAKNRLHISTEMSQR